MKRLTLLAAIGIFYISSAFTGAPQSHSTQKETSVSAAGDFAFLRAHRQGRGITLTWGMTTNAGLAGFDIEKTTQDPNDIYSVWEPVASISGSDMRSFKTTDKNVLPGTTYYRITAWYLDGRSATSEIVSVRIVSH